MTTLPQISHLKTWPSFDTLTIMKSIPFCTGYRMVNALLPADQSHEIMWRAPPAFKRQYYRQKMGGYWLLFPRFGGCLASSGVLMSGRMWVMGKHWYSSQEQDGHFRRSCSLLSRVYSLPQSIQTYFPGPTFCPAEYVFSSVRKITKLLIHVKDIYQL